MTSPHIRELPEELVEHILRWVKDTASPTDFWSCLRTCHQWHRVGLGLYKGLGFAACATIESDTRRCDVKEETAGLKFHLRIDFDLKMPSQLYFSLLRSLTIHIRHQRIAIPFAPSRGCDLVRYLQEVFTTTGLLSTFSLRFADGWDFPNLDVRNAQVRTAHETYTDFIPYLQVPAIPQSLLARLVEVLPETVIHLELDTCGTDVPPSMDFTLKNKEEHLCYQISKILARLRRLRLRVGHICNALLAFQTDTQSCNHVASCEYCIASEQATCALLRSWQMRSMTVWIPWGQPAEDNTFVQTSKALMNPSLRNLTVIVLVHQNDEKHNGRTSIIEPSESVYTQFTYRPQSNVSTAVRERLEYFKFNSVTGGTLKSETVAARQRLERLNNFDRICNEHDTLISTSVRLFNLSPSFGPIPEAGSTSPYPHMAEQTLESMVSWTQNMHLGYRFPISEGNECGKPFWKESKIWACRVVCCKERCETLVHLRGHHMWAHPERLHEASWSGYEPCPSIGCDRVGMNAFESYREAEEHLLAHHLRPCTFHIDAAGESAPAES